MIVRKLLIPVVALAVVVLLAHLAVQAYGLFMQLTKMM